MFDVLDFIDSMEIRECNKDRKFTPIEQASLIEMSRRKSIFSKMSAWADLLQNYDEFEFRKGEVGGLTGKGIDFKEVVRNTIQKYGKLLSYRDLKEGVVFCARLEEAEYPIGPSGDLYFSDFSHAWKYLIDEKNEYLQQEDLRKIETGGIISLRWLDKQEVQRVDYIYDNDLDLVEIRHCGLEDFNPVELEDFYVYVKAPFRKGDRLRMILPDFNGERFYGTLNDDPDSPEYIDFAKRYGDRSEMSIRLDQVRSRKGLHGPDHIHINLLYLERDF